MKRKNIACIAVLLFTGAFVFSSCNEDKGNYDYRDIDGVAGTFGSNGYEGIAINDLYQVEPGETLVITPEIEFIKKTPDEYRYEWWAYELPVERNVEQEPVLIGEECNLEFPMEGDWSKPTTAGKELTFLLKVINTKTDIEYYRKTFVSVNLYSKTGFVALTKKAGNQFDLDVVGLNAGIYGVYTDVLSKLEVDIDRTAEPRDIASGYDFNAPGKYGFYLLTDQYSTRLNQTDYSYSEDYNLTRQVEPWSPLKNKPLVGKKIVVRAYTINGLNSRIYLLGDDGNWYFTNTSAMAYFDVPVNRDRANELKSYATAPYMMIQNNESVIGRNASALFFSKELPGFTVQTGIGGASNIYSTRAVEAVVPGTAGIARANYRLMFQDTEDPNTDLVYMHEGFAILKGSSPEYRFVTFTTIANGINVDANAAFRAYLPASLQNVKHWVFKKETSGGMLFCVTGDDKIYALNLKNLAKIHSDDNENGEIGAAPGASWQWTTERFKEITSEIIKPPYTKITCFKKVDDSNQIKLTEDGTIVLATYDPNGEVGKNGQLQFFNYDSTNEKLVAKEMTTKDGTVTNAFTGLGEVVAVTYKL